MNLKTLALVFGVVFLALGLLGFVPGATTDGMLLGIFMVDMPHNLVHLLSGAAGLYVGLAAAKSARMYFQAVGVVYALVTVLGFLTGSALVVAVPVNMADNLLHVVLAAAGLYLGFMFKETAAAPSSTTTNPGM